MQIFILALLAAAAALTVRAYAFPKRVKRSPLPGFGLAALAGGLLLGMLYFGSGTGSPPDYQPGDVTLRALLE